MSYLSMACKTAEGESSTTNLASNGTENLWVASQSGRDGYEGNAMLLNMHDVTVMSLEGEGPSGYTVTTLVAGAEGGSVNVSNDDFTASLGYSEGRAAVVLSRDEASGPELEMQLTDERATLTMKDANGTALATYPE